MITVQDLRKVGDVAQDCDLRKVNEAISTAIEYDLSELLCGLFFDVERYLRGDEVIPERIEKLLNKTYFDDCNGEKYHLGLIHITSLLAYARYVQINAYHDSHSGITQKRSDWANFTSNNELKNYSHPYFNQAKQAFKEVQNYICKNRDLYKRYDFSKCASKCGCSSNCNNNQSTRNGFEATLIKVERP